jgi:hypothetical protein
MDDPALRSGQGSHDAAAVLFCVASALSLGLKLKGYYVLHVTSHQARYHAHMLAVSGSVPILYMCLVADWPISPCVYVVAS